MGSQAVPADQEHKPCVACGEMIPVHATICSHCQHSQIPDKTNPMKAILGWVGGISAILGLGATLMGGLHSLTAGRAQRAAVKTELILAQTQAQQSEYEAALTTYKDILQKDPGNALAREGQRSTLMLWIEYFHVVVPEDQDPGTIAGPKLDQIFGMLDTQRIRSQGPQLADVLAHVGWAHWLNNRVAQRESDDDTAPQRNLRAALAIDPGNVYANAMLGHILIELNEDLIQGRRFLAAALATGRQRSLVREMQLSALLNRTGMPGSCEELVRAANQMRLGGESLDEIEKHGILVHAFNANGSQEGLTASLSAVPPDQAWATYQWLGQGKSEYAPNTTNSNFISANLLEISGKRDQALVAFRALQKQLPPDGSYALRDHVEVAVKRLSRPA